jgi:iron complex outermembrane receptor protein
MLASTTQVFAEDSDIRNQGDLTQIPIEQLVTMDVQRASKIASQISAAPSAVSIVTADDIKAYGYHTLAEILESLRGLYITNDRAYSYLGGRGFGQPGDYAGRTMLTAEGVARNLDEQQSRHLFGKLEWQNWFAELAFDVSYAQAKNAKLSISSKLLRVARRVLQ